jgi:CSLREA domain-containing protein
MARAILNMAVFLSLPLALVGTGLAQTCMVTVTTDGDIGTLRSCLTNPGTYTIITFSPSVTGTITLTSPLPAISTNLTIQGPGAGSLTISGANAYPVFTISSGTVSISGLTIANGNETAAGAGGGIINEGTLTVSNSTLSGNSASGGSAGGGIANFGTLTVTNNTFSGNSASGGGAGGGIANNGTLTVTNSTFSGNSAVGGGAGGGITNDVTLTVTNSIFSGNSGTNAGGIYNSDQVNDSNNVFFNNATENASGFTLSATDVTGKDPMLLPLGNYGGPTETMLPLPGSPAICVGSSSLVPSGVTTDQRGFPLDASCVDAGAVQTNYLMVNTAGDSNDDSCTTATCSLRDAITAANTSTMGDIGFSPTLFTATPPATVPSIVLSTSLPALRGQINIVGPVASTPPALTSVTVSGNDTVGSLFTVNSGAQVFLYGMTIANGIATSGYSGGGITNQGTLTVSNSTFSGNLASGEVDAGGIVNYGDSAAAPTTLTVRNSTFSGNLASGVNDAGGILNYGDSATAPTTLTVTNSTFSGNSASGGPDAGGIVNTGISSTAPATLTLTNSIFSGNLATGLSGAGGIYNTGEEVFNGSNNVFFNNAMSGAEADCDNCTTNTNPVNANPMLASLGNYGGTTQTMLPLPGSPAICAGLASLAVNASGSPLTTDQRGATHSGAYCTVAQVDAGSVQTDYTSIQFTNIPSGGAYTALQSTVPSPAPMVAVMENGQSIGGVPLMLTDASNTVSGLGPVTTAAGTGATFTGLEDSAIEDTTLSATLPITSSYSLTTSPTAGFDVTSLTLTLSPTLPNAAMGMPYSQTISASDGTAPYSYSISAGAPPAGLSLSTSGVLSGTPTAAGSFSFTVTATESSNSSITGSQSYTLAVARRASQTTVSASPTVASPAQTVTLTAVVAATVSGTSIVPSGTVTFLDNGTQIGTATLSGGTAQLVVPSLPAGATAVITATYAGDGNFLGSTSSNSASVVVASLDFSFTNTGTSAYTAAPGAVATYNFALAPLYGSYAGPVNFSVTGLPPGATPSFTPSTVASTAGASPVVMTVQTAAATAHNSSPFGRGIVLALLFLPVLSKRRVRERLRGKMLLLVLLMAGLTATLTGCGSTNGFMLQNPQTYTLTVTASSGTLQHSQTVTLVVQ